MGVKSVIRNSMVRKNSKGADSKGVKCRSVPTGVGNWHQLYCDQTSKYYFYNVQTKASSWGLPLREANSSSDDRGCDWECCICPQTGRKFFQSTKYNKVQWTLPLVYRKSLMGVPYFSNNGHLKKQQDAKKIVSVEPKQTQLDVAKVLDYVTIEDVLNDGVVCAALHRFLVATHAEENLLFWGAAEVFRVGTWKGMKVIGENSKMGADSAVGDSQLQEQLVKTRASARIGLTTPLLCPKDEAQTIYEQFLKPSAPMEVCVHRKVSDDILESIENMPKNSEDRTILEAAQEEVLRNMEVDLLPRFLKTSLAPDGKKVGQGENTYSGDEVVRRAIQRVFHSKVPL